MKNSLKLSGLLIVLIILLVITFLIRTNLNNVSENVEDTNRVAPEVLTVDSSRSIVNSRNITTNNGGYYHEGVRVYWRGEIMPDAHYSSFEVLGNNVAKDKNNIYIGNKILYSVDYGSFNLLENETLFGRQIYSDKNGKYLISYDYKLIEIPFDYKKSTVIDYMYVSSSKGIYKFDGWNLSKVEEADPETFHRLGVCAAVEMSRGYYYADKNNVYIGSSILQSADIETFEKVGEKHAEGGELPYSLYVWKDKDSIYASCGVLIEEVDYETFEFKDGEFQDKNNIYHLHTGGGYRVESKR